MEMKKVALILPILLLLLGFALPNTAMAHTEGDPFVTDLIAGGGNPASAIDVGDVIVWNDADYLYVKYVITEPDWCLIETHLHVDTSWQTIPQKNGNPIPGHFDYSMEHECVTEYTYEIPQTWVDGDTLYIAAHAVVMDTSCYQTAILYGIERYNGKVYGVDVLTGTSWEIFDNIPPPPEGSATPNGLAYDGVNGRFYYTNYQNTPYTLYFWEAATNTEYVAGYIAGHVAGADFWDGKYYYITGPPPTDDLWEVEFNTDGTIASNTKVDDIANNEHGWTFNGDIAVKDGVVYGWGLCGMSGHGYEFFTYDIATKAFSFVKPSYQQSLQLTFGSNGVLYGHRSGGAGAFYVVDTTTGGVTLVTPTPCPFRLYTDCASGMICEPIIETAWGFGTGFPGKNWATYITYGWEWSERWPETGTAYIGYEDWTGGDFDYNDFGMSMVVTEIYSSDGIEEIDIRCQGLVKLAGWHHKIHIKMTDSVTAYVHLEEWDKTETTQYRSDDYTFTTGEIDVLLFDDTATDVGHITTVHIAFEDPVDLTMAPPYDPYIWVYNTGLTYHIDDTQSKTMPAGTADLPYILVVPVTWLPPAEQRSIWTVYGYFDDYYVSGSPADWYDTYTGPNPTVPYVPYP
jgi:hypothetical protein